MPKIDLDSIVTDARAFYPPPLDRVVAGRQRKRLAKAGGLTQFGVNLTTLTVGAASALRHRHSDEDEFVYVLRGVVTLIDADGETELQAGDSAAFPKNDGNAHHLVNRGTSAALILEIGTCVEDDVVIYDDVGMMLRMASDASRNFTDLEGRPWTSPDGGGDQS